MKHQNNAKEITIYLGLTFLITWSLWLLGPALMPTKISMETFMTLGIFTPSLVGLMMTFCLSGLKGMKLALISLVNVKISFKGYLYGLGLMPAILLSAYGLMQLTGASIPKSEFPLEAMPLVFLYILIFMGPLGEEAGWRGFLLKQLLVNQKPLYASIFVGFIWTIWHLPLFFIETTIQSTLVTQYDFGMAFIGYAIYTLILSILITILYIHTKGNVFATILFHTMANTSLGMMPLILIESGALLLLGVMILVAVIVIIIGRKALFKYA